MAFEANASTGEPAQPSDYEYDVRWPDQLHLVMVAADVRGVSICDNDVEELMAISGLADATRDEVHVSDQAWELFVAAGEVTKANDDGNMEEAWQKVDALLWGRFRGTGTIPIGASSPRDVNQGGN